MGVGLEIFRSSVGVSVSGCGFFISLFFIGVGLFSFFFIGYWSFIVFFFVIFGVGVSFFDF